MGEHDEIRFEHDEGARALLDLLRAQVGAANAAIADLHAALSDRDCKRIVNIRARLDTAWKAAESTIIKLEQISRRIEVSARETLRNSQAKAREPLSQAWTLLLRANPS